MLTLALFTQDYYYWCNYIHMSVDLCGAYTWDEQSLYFRWIHSHYPPGYDVKAMRNINISEEKHLLFSSNINNID